MRVVPLLLIVTCAAMGTACSTSQTYASGQAWRQGQCNKIIDMQERERCMAPTREPYDSYQRKANAAKKRDAAE